MSKSTRFVAALLATLALAASMPRDIGADHTALSDWWVLEAPIKVGYDASLISAGPAEVSQSATVPPFATSHPLPDALRDGTLQAVEMWNGAMGVNTLTWGGEYLGGDDEDLDIIVVQFADPIGGWTYEGRTYDCGGRRNYAMPVRIREDPPRFMIRICFDPGELAWGISRLMAHEMGHIAWMADGYPGEHPPGYCGIMGPVCEPPSVNYAEAARARAAWWTGVPLPQPPTALDLIIEQDPGEPALHRVKLLIQDHDEKDGFFLVRLSQADGLRSREWTAYTEPDWGLRYPHDEVLTDSDGRGFAIDWNPRTAGVCATPRAVNRNGSSHGSTVCNPLPTRTPELQETVPLMAGCNAVAWTGSDKTPIATIAGAVSPAGVLEALWEFEAATWLGYSPLHPEVSDLTDEDFLDVVFVCVGGSGPGAATYTRPIV